MDTNTVLENHLAGAPAPSAQPTGSAPKMARRQFLSWMGLVGAAAVVAACTNQGTTGTIVGSASSTQETSTEALPTAVAQPTPTAAASTQTGTSFSSSCVQRCPGGCSYPGRCKRYTDANGNGRCDLGECI